MLISHALFNWITFQLTELHHGFYFLANRKTELTLYSFPLDQAKIEKMRVIFGQIEEKIRTNSRISVFLDWKFPRIPKNRKRTSYRIHPKSRLLNSNCNIKCREEYKKNLIKMTNKKLLSIILRYKLENIMREDVYLLFI